MYHLKASNALRGYTPKLHLKGSQGKGRGGEGGGPSWEGGGRGWWKQRKEDEEVRASESGGRGGGGRSGKSSTLRAPQSKQGKVPPEPVWARPPSCEAWVGFGHLARQPTSQEQKLFPL